MIPGNVVYQLESLNYERYKKDMKIEAQSPKENYQINEYWKRIGGGIIYKFCLWGNNSSKGYNQRRVDAIILPDEENKKLDGKTYSLKGKNIIVIQAKLGRLCMYGAGQGYFSMKLLEEFQPKSIKSVLIVESTDTKIEPFLLELGNIELIEIEIPKTLKTG